MDQKKKTWLSVGDKLLAILYPPACMNCGICLPPFEDAPTMLCDECLAEFKEAAVPRQPLGDDALSGGIAGPVSLVFYHPHKSPRASEQVIYYIKHKDDRRAFAYMGRLLAGPVAEALGELGIPSRELLVTYPPRRPEAKRKDGFDQAEKLAKALARELEGECICLLGRTRRRSLEQKRLTAEERAANAAASYCLSDKTAPTVKGRVVVLVDDLYTTGATLRTCAELLLEAGALLVLLATVGKTAGTAET